MANVTVVTVGSLKEGYLREAVAEYKDIAEIAEEPTSDPDSTDNAGEDENA